VSATGRLQAGDELLQVNESVLFGRNHVEVVSVLKDLPQRVHIVCARPHDILHNLRSAGADVPTTVSHSLFKAKSEQAGVNATVASNVKLGYIIVRRKAQLKAF